jgi:hypothetical protein
VGSLVAPGLTAKPRWYAAGATFENRYDPFASVTVVAMVEPLGPSSETTVPLRPAASDVPLVLRKRRRPRKEAGWRRRGWRCIKHERSVCREAH